jgi:hypothetical protein
VNCTAYEEAEEEKPVKKFRKTKKIENVDIPL